jgi:hypothetical protein
MHDRECLSRKKQRLCLENVEVESESCRPGLRLRAGTIPTAASGDRSRSVNIFQTRSKTWQQGEHPRP